MNASLHIQVKKIQQQKIVCTPYRAVSNIKILIPNTFNIYNIDHGTDDSHFELKAFFQSAMFFSEKANAAGKLCKKPRTPSLKKDQTSRQRSQGGRDESRDRFSRAAANLNRSSETSSGS